MSSREGQLELPKKGFSDPQYTVTPPDGHLSEVSVAQYLVRRTDEAAARHMDRVSAMIGAVLKESGFDYNNEDDARAITLARVAGQIHDLGKIQRSDDHGQQIGKMYRSQGAGYIIGEGGLVLTQGLELPDREIVAAVCESHHARVPNYPELTNPNERMVWGIVHLMQPLDRLEQVMATGRPRNLHGADTMHDQVFKGLPQAAPLIAGREIAINDYVRQQLQPA